MLDGMTFEVAAPRGSAACPGGCGDEPHAVLVGTPCAVAMGWSE